MENDSEPLCEANAYTKAKEYAARIEQLEAALRSMLDLAHRALPGSKTVEAARKVLNND